ncbi:biogenesis of lysosome-related organelles complex 1 subunit 1 [Amazona aestiva]|uniref:Biogenesis of lysosome-related organelles complex 1 subunit 1 n=1 Tax=Amazona aestiva TaxID=12930 RepID=A0A0Q3LUD3_AMAAE|nr:biogenesis of lysosome-related organelles complex 1 subunit 1 [Amazona aestiva]
MGQGTESIGRIQHIPSTPSQGDEEVFLLLLLLQHPEAERRRRDAIAAATRLTEALVDHLNVGVAQAYVNQRKLDHEVKTLQVQAAQFAKQTGQWITMVENFNQALKEIGDVENWARSIEMDMRSQFLALGRTVREGIPE